jgi:2-oxoglutarate ferredoxin oxidoreductase subunit gamma
MMREGRDTIEIRLAGFGGQGVILAGLLLGQAAVNDGWFAAGSNSYGAQARGSACKADIVLSHNPIDYPHVERPAVFVAMSQGGYDAFEAQVNEEGRIFYDSGLVSPSEGRTQTGLDITQISLNELGNKQVANVVWLGAVVGAEGWFSRKALEKAAEQHVPARFLALNQKALVRGLELGQNLKEA